MSLRLSFALLLIAALSIAIAHRTAADGLTRLQTWQEHVRMRDNSPFRGMHWQPLGPSMQGARIEALAVPAPGSSTIYAGPGAGNVWKSVNNGMTWQPIFEHESAFAIGDIAVAPSNPDIVWVGTGEVQPRHSGPAYAGTRPPALAWHWANWNRKEILSHQCYWRQESAGGGRAYTRKGTWSGAPKTKP